MMEVKQCRELTKVKLKARKIDFCPNCVQNLLCSTQRTQCHPIIRSNQLVLYTDIITACCENHTKHKYALRQNAVS